MKKIFIYVNGCELRRIDAKRFKKYFSKNNYKIVNNPRFADFILFVTCAYLNNMANHSINKIKEFKKYDADLIVAGCLPEIEKEKLAKIFDGRTISTKNIDHIDNLFPENKIKYKDMTDENSLYYIWNESTSITYLKDLFRKNKFLEKTYLFLRKFILKNLFGKNSISYRFLVRESFFIRISGGCLSNCSYCAIKKAIGSLKSKPVKQCLDELKKGLDQENKNFIITADDIGCYGLDINSSLPALLDEMVNFPGNYKMLIRGLCPRWIVKYIENFERILKSKKINRIDIPIQSGSRRILRLMNRYSDIDEIKQDLLKIRKSYPQIILFAHFIIGFPSETEEEFKETLSFIKEVGFDSGIFFPFSCKPGTAAEKIEPKISKKEMNKRLKIAKKFLKKSGYSVKHQVDMGFFVFEKCKI